MEHTRTRRLTVVGYAVLAYAVFLVASAWAVTFLADVQLPRGIDHGTRQPVGLAVVIDVALLLLFAVQHSVMARSGFKCWAARWVPPHVERSTYVLAASLALLLLFWQWQPVGTPVWDLHGVLAGAIWVLFALGWLIAVSSTFIVDHLDVFGVRRAYRHARGRYNPPAAFQERWLYGWVRHPLMLGLLVASWATPRMTTGHLLFATAATGYIVIGVRFEEHDLEHELGDLYRDYASRVPAFLPVRRPTETRQREAAIAHDARMVEDPDVDFSQSVQLHGLTGHARPRRLSAMVSVGLFPPEQLLADPQRLGPFLDKVAAAGLDHVCCGDHVSFIAGAGFDGILHAAVIAALNPELSVHTGVYLLPLRHPVLVARQLADLERLWPGRLVFGVGIGGEDRHEVSICGVDPATRGKRMDECLTVVRQLLSGTPTTFHGEFFDLDEALIAPAPRVPTPIVVGGRSDAAIRRAGRHGDGWLGIWNSPRRFAQAVDLATQEAERVGRPDSPKGHAMQVWCGLAPTRQAARAALAPTMESFYQVPFERFERYSPYGTAEDVAEFLSAYVEAGCTAFNLIPQGVDEDELIAATAAVKKLLDR